MILAPLARLNREGNCFGNETLISISGTPFGKISGIPRLQSVVKV